MIQIQSKIRQTKQISVDFFELTFDWTGPRPTPGQFFTIRVSTLTDPLLRRPFAFAGCAPDAKSATMIYQRRGPATTLLAGLGQGETFDMIGPLGNGFSLSGSAARSLLVAGGVGLGPILFLAGELEKAGAPATFVFGARNARAVPELAEFRELKPVICTDDGSEGFHGTAVDYLRTLDSSTISQSLLYCCGPNPMLQACHKLAVKHDIACQVSMEQIMACGVGACMGCVIKTTTEPGYARVCTEGPVFDSREVLWS